MTEYFKSLENKGKTHWEGCWKDREHFECALSRIHDLSQQVYELRVAMMPFAHLGATMDKRDPSEKVYTDCGPHEMPLVVADFRGAYSAMYGRHIRSNHKKLDDSSDAICGC